VAVCTWGYCKLITTEPNNFIYGNKKFATARKLFSHPNLAMLINLQLQIISVGGKEMPSKMKI
jgi:energy-coupling factor transporter transmembrane protein EcfT